MALPRRTDPTGTCRSLHIQSCKLGLNFFDLNESRSLYTVSRSSFKLLGTSVSRLHGGETLIVVISCKHNVERFVGALRILHSCKCCRTVVRMVRKHTFFALHKAAANAGLKWPHFQGPCERVISYIPFSDALLERETYSVL